MKIVVWIGFVIVGFSFLSFLSDNTFDRKEKLSEYGFFKGRLSALDPAENVLSYDVNTPLFSNYSEKLRFIKLPENTTAQYNDSVAFDFPEGTILIKNFYFPNDFRKPEKGRRILETRLLVNEASGWQAYPYIWNEEQTEATYDPAGETRAITYVNASGRKITTPYVIPNKNQCKGCHIRGDKMMPIGLTANQLNGEFNYAVGKKNQLIHWQESGIIDGLPELSSIPKLAVWNKESTGTLDARARAYLHANCGHCHSKAGPANTSGLFLDIFEKDPAHLGVNKAPVAAGRGAGNLKYDIKPGDPSASILIFRMKTNDPAIAMPEIGREQVHAEGVALIEEWIRKNTFTVH